MRWTKGSANKAPISCPEINYYNNDMGGVDTMDQKTAAFRDDSQTKYRFYLGMFFDLIDVALVNSYIVCMKLGHDISLLNF